VEIQNPEGSLHSLRFHSKISKRRGTGGAGKTETYIRKREFNRV